MPNKSKKRIMKLKGFLYYLYSLLLLRYTKFNRTVLRKKIKKLNIDKLHLGCGKILLKGWLNVVFEKREEYGRVVDKGGAWYLNCDLLKEWPIEDRSVKYIAASHLIEHFDLNAGVRFASEAFRVLENGGIVRLNCPDLETYARNYVEGNLEFFNNIHVREACCFKGARTNGEIFAAKAYDSGCAHRWFYDFESLRDILQRSGFKKISKATRAKSYIPDIEKIEPAEREIETVYIEALKE